MSGLVTKTKLTFRVELEEQGGDADAQDRPEANDVPREEEARRATQETGPAPGDRVRYGIPVCRCGVTEVRRGEVEAKNLVLSYQYSTKLVTWSEDGEAKQVSGIIIPDDGKRLSLPDFIAFAVGAWLERFPGEKAPYSIYLVGHFNRRACLRSMSSRRCPGRTCPRSAIRSSRWAAPSSSRSERRPAI